MTLNFLIDNLLSIFNRKEILLILVISLFLIVILYPHHGQNSDWKNKYNQGYNTQFGHFEPNFLRNDSQILWEGYTTDIRANKTIKRAKEIPLGRGYLEIREWNYSTNRYGLRGEINQIQDENKTSLKVLVLGSSSTLGYWIDYENTTTGKLEKMLKKDYSDNIQVINGGLSHSGLIDYYLTVTTLQSKLNPDIVIMNDIEGRSSLSRLETKYMIKKILDRIDQSNYTGDPNIASMKVRNQIHTLRFNSLDYLFSSNETFKYIKKTNDYLKQKNTTLYLNFNRGNEGITENKEITKNFASRNNISVINEPKFFRDNIFERYRYQDGHLTREGHSILARHIYENVNWSAHLSE